MSASRIPDIYADALVLCVLPPCPQTGRHAIGFQSISGEVYRLAISKTDARTLARLLTDFYSCVEPAGSHSLGSSLMPIEPKSVPSGGMNT